MPSPAIATTWPCSLQPFYDLTFLLRQYLSLDLIDSQLPRDSLGGGAAVAGEHHNAYPILAEHLDGFGG